MSLSWTRFIESYYIWNTLAVLSYVPVRLFIMTETSYLTSDDFMGLNREKQVYCLFLLMLFMKYKKCSTMEAFVGTFFIYAKCALLLLTFMAETRVAVYYLILNIVLFITCTQQEYQGPNKVQYLKGYDFDALVEKDTSDKMWLVEFYTTWADDCVQFSSLYSHLSLKYATPSYVFAKVDIGFNGEIAKKYQIDVSTSSKQLPTLMLFQRGKPISQYRLPPLRADGSVHRCVMNEEIIARFFELETMTMSKAGGAPAAGDVNAAPVIKKAVEKQANNKKSK